MMGDCLFTPEEDGRLYFLSSVGCSRSCSRFCIVYGNRICSAQFSWGRNRQRVVSVCSWCKTYSLNQVHFCPKTYNPIRSWGLDVIGLLGYISGVSLFGAFIGGKCDKKSVVELKGQLRKVNGQRSK